MGIAHSRLQQEQQLKKYSIWGILAGRMVSRGIFQTMPFKDGEIPQINHGNGSRKREILVGSLCISSSLHCMIELASLRKLWRSLCKLLSPIRRIMRHL